MPERKTMKRALRDKREGTAPGTQAGEFVREEMDHIREGTHGARSTKQAIAIGLSKARRAGVDLPPPKKGTTSEKARLGAKRAYQAGHDGASKIPSPKRSHAAAMALQREPHAAATKASLSKQASTASHKRSKADRSASARRAAMTKGVAGRGGRAQGRPNAREKRRLSLSPPDAGQAIVYAVLTVV